VSVVFADVGSEMSLDEVVVLTKTPDRFRER